MSDSIQTGLKQDDKQWIFPRLYRLLESRRDMDRLEESYTARLMYDGSDAILKKIGEETTEVILAAKNGNQREQVHEFSDLCFHLLVLMVKQKIPLKDVESELERRFGESGLAEKNRRLTGGI